MSVLQLVLRSLQNHQVVGREDDDAPFPLESIELLHRLGMHCPLDSVAEALAPFLEPLIDTNPARAIAFAVQMVAGIAKQSFQLRNASRRNVDENRMGAGAIKSGQLSAALAFSSARANELQAELLTMQDAYLSESQAFLVKTEAYRRHLQSKDDEITKLHQSCAVLASRLRTVEVEVSALKNIAQSEFLRNRDSIHDETSRSNALRAAWHSTENEVKAAEGRSNRLQAEFSLAHAMFKIQTDELEERASLAIEFAQQTGQWVALEPFRRAVWTACRLRTSLQSLTQCQQ